MDFGYYKVGRPTTNYFADVKKIGANLVYLGAVDAGTSESTPEARLARFKNHLTQAARKGFKIMLDLEMGQPTLPLGQVLKAARPHWDRVGYIILGDELDAEGLDDAELRLSNKLQALGLAPRSIGATFTPDTTLSMTPSMFDPLSFVNIEAYTQPCHAGDCGRPDEPDRIVRLVDRMKAHVPTRCDLTIVLQGYDRNGAWTQDHELLARCNSDVYFRTAKGDPRVKALVAFAWDRPGGTKTIPQLQTAHKTIIRDMRG